MRASGHSAWWWTVAVAVCAAGSAPVLLQAAALRAGGDGAPSRASAPEPGVPLQPLLDATPEGGVLTLAPGRYLGPAHVDRRMTVDGQGKAVVDGRGKGTILVVRAAGTVVTGLRLTGTGMGYDGTDAAIEVNADDVRVTWNVIDDALFGVHLRGGSRGLVCGNRISSKPEEPGLRGDAVRVWSGTANRIVGNDVFLARDVSVSNAEDTVVERNVVRDGRMGLNLVFAPRTLVSGNWFDKNLSGVAVLYSNEVVLRGNRVQHSQGVLGTGVSFKESSHCLMEHNAVVHCALGVKINDPNDAENVVTFSENRFAHNIAGIDFYGENGGHVLHGNRFEKNLSQVTVSAPMAARGHDWKDNAWDDYEGFDRDHDGVGDTPYELYGFADRIWMEEPMAMFFRNSPALELLDFLERLAPFASPELTLSDPTPVVRPPADALSGAPPVVPFCPEPVASAGR